MDYTGGIAPIGTTAPSPAAFSGVSTGQSTSIPQLLTQGRIDSQPHYKNPLAFLTVTQRDLTQLLQEARTGDSAARAELIQTAYEDLRTLAAKRMRAQRQDHTLTATALVHEVTLRLLGGGATPGDRTGFFAFASCAMRNLLVDHARARGSQKRGGDLVKLSFDQVALHDEDKRGEVLAINEALEELAAIDERKAKVVEMRYFGGLTIPEVAGVLGVSEGTVKRDWDLARAWLKRWMQADDPDDGAAG